MLEGLDDINWQQLTHAYGPATVVPDLIRKLASPSPKVWEQGLEGLRSTIWHQGTVYEASAYAIPFLIELLEHPEVQCRDQILIDLALLARGGTAYDFFFDAWDRVEQQIHNAVARGLPLYLSLLRESDSRVRRHVPFTLDVLPECAPTVIPVVENHLLQETDPQVKAHLLFYLSNQPDYQKADDQWLREWVTAEGEHPFVRTMAAMVHVRRAKEETPPETVQALLKTLVTPKTVEDLYWALPWAHRHLVVDISKDLLLLPVDTAPQALPALLQALKNADRACRLPLETRYRRGSLAGPDIVYALLYFAFAGKPLPKNAVPFLLTTAQRAILTSILQSEAAWRGADQTAKLFDTFGLPYRGKLQELLLL
jgi:hypothetical protein